MFFYMGGRCTKTRTYMKTSNSKDNVFGKFDGLQFFSRMFIWEFRIWYNNCCTWWWELNGLKTWQDIGSKTQQVDNMESQEVARDDYEFQKINWRVQLWFEDLRTLSQTTHQCWHVEVCARTPNLFSFWLHWRNYEWEVCTYQFL